MPARRNKRMAFCSSWGGDGRVVALYVLALLLRVPLHFSASIFFVPFFSLGSMASITCGYLSRVCGPIVPLFSLPFNF